MPTNYRGNDTTDGNTFNRQQENNAIVNSEFDEIFLKETQKVSAEKGSHESIESHFDDRELYQIDNMSLEDTKEELE